MSFASTPVLDLEYESASDTSLKRQLAYNDDTVDYNNDNSMVMFEYYIPEINKRQDHPWLGDLPFVVHSIERYCSSVTGSSHTFSDSSPGTANAKCANHESLAAPCQCLTLAGIWITVPGRISTAGFPSS